LLRWVGDLSEFGIAAAAGEDALLSVYVDGTLGAVKPDLVARGQPGGGAHAHVHLGAVGQFVQDIHVVGNAHGTESPTSIAPVRYVHLGHGHDAITAAHPAHHGLIGGTDIQGVVPTQLPVVAPV